MTVSETADQPFLLDRDALMKRFGITVSNSTLLRWEQLGRFPRRVKLAGTRVAWLASEVIAFLAKCSADRSRTYYADSD